MKRRGFGNEEASEEAGAEGQQEQSNRVEVCLLVEFFVCLPALVPSENGQQPFLCWREKWHVGVWRGQGQPVCLPLRPSPLTGASPVDHP